MRAACGGRLSAQRELHSQAHMLRRARAVRKLVLRSSRVALQELGGGAQVAEALAAALALDGKELLTAAWSLLPSGLLGQRRGQMTYDEGVQLFLSQGASMQHAAADRRQGQGAADGRPLRIVLADIRDAGGGGGTAALTLPAAQGLAAAAMEQLPAGLSSTEQHLLAALQHLPDVESHLQPAALALALPNAPGSTAAVNVAAVADAAWCRVPSTVLGTRPAWLGAEPEWRYGQLLQLSAAWGFQRVRRVLEQPCRELACLELRLHCFSTAVRSDVATARGNVERITGLSLPELLERGRGKAAEEGSNRYWGFGLDGLEADLLAGLEDGGLAGLEDGGLAGLEDGGLAGLEDGGLAGLEHGGLPGLEDGGLAGLEHGGLAGLEDGGLAGLEDGGLAGLEWSAAIRTGRDEAYEIPLTERGTGELLQLQLCTPDGSGKRTVEFSPPRLLPPPVDVDDYMELPSDFVMSLLSWAQVHRGRDLFVKGWGAFPISLEPQLRGSSLILPQPREVRAQGYATALFPQAGKYAQLSLVMILDDPSSLLAQYIVKWASRLNGPLAACIDELALNEEELDLDLPPEALLRRLERPREPSSVPFERFDWLAGPPGAGDGPRVLGCKVGGDGEELHVLLLTSSHQIAAAGRALDNCVGREMLDSHLRDMRDMDEMMLVLSTSTDVQDAKAMASWKGRWDQVYEAGNQPIRAEWEAMFLGTEAEVRRIWDNAQLLRGQAGDNSDTFDDEFFEVPRYSKLSEQLMQWDHPKFGAAVTGSGVEKDMFVTRLASVLSAMSAGQEAEGGEGIKASRLARLLRSGGCSRLFSPDGFRSLKEFIEELPIPAVWDDSQDSLGDCSGRVRFL